MPSLCRSVIILELLFSVSSPELSEVTASVAEEGESCDVMVSVAGDGDSCEVTFLSSDFFSESRRPLARSCAATIGVKTGVCSGFSLASINDRPSLEGLGEPMTVATGRDGSGLLTSGGVLLLDRGCSIFVSDNERTRIYVSSSTHQRNANRVGSLHIKRCLANNSAKLKRDYKSSMVGK